MIMSLSSIFLSFETQSFPNRFNPFQSIDLLRPRYNCDRNSEPIHRNPTSKDDAEAMTQAHDAH